MSFRRRLIGFLLAMLALVQVATGAAVYGVMRNTLITQGKNQLTASAGLFQREFDEIQRLVATNVHVLTLDYPLREAVAGHQTNTVLSVLDNHRRRIGASRMMLVELDGRIAVDSGRADGISRQFPYPALLDDAAAGGRGTSVVAADGEVGWLVVTPILAPDPIAFLAAYFPMDDNFIHRMQQLSALPGTVALAAASGRDSWVPTAGSSAAPLVGQLPPPGHPLAKVATLAVLSGGEFMYLATPLATQAGTPAVAVVMGYPLSDALKPYGRIMYILLGLLLVSLAAAILFAVRIAHGVSRPIEALALQTKRIEAGDYSPPPPTGSRDEIGQLNAAFGRMARVIGEREERIRFQASHDAVTGFSNRIAFLEKITRSGLNRRGALLSIGVIRYQEIANTIGRDVTENLMRACGARLIRLVDGQVFGCTGERGFGVWIPDIDSEAVQVLAMQLVAAFEAPYRQGDLAIDTPVAVGAAFCPDHGSNPELLLRHAEVALQIALGADDRFAFYSPAADPHRPERLSLMSELRQGLQRNELQLYYQPKLSLASNRLVGAEALVRWHHPQRGFIPPDDFISLAEQTGNIQPLTRWALETGIRWAARWSGAGNPIAVSINLSVRDLADSGLPRRVAALLAREGVKPEHLVLEITESAIMGEPDTALRTLQLLADQNIALSIDDFGVGQSSLTYLRRLPVRELKIDKSFVSNLATDTDNQIIVRSVIDLGRRLGYRVTAEGVEDAATLQLLREFGCDYAQGYLIAKPLPEAACEAMFLGSGQFDLAGRSVA